MALQSLNIKTDLIDQIGDSGVRNEMDLLFKYVASPRYGTGIDNSNAKYWQESTHSNTVGTKYKWPSRAQVKDIDKAPAQIVVKCSQAALDDILIRYRVINRKRLANRIKTNTKGDGQGEVTIGFNLPLTDGIPKKNQTQVVNGVQKRDPGHWVQKVKFVKTGKVVTSTGAKVSESTMTRIQELCSAYVIKMSMKRGMELDTSAKIRKNDKVMLGLRKIFKRIGDVDDVDDDWIHNFAAQNKEILLNLNNREYTQFNREGGFMDWITKFIRSEFGISSKDNWNPADIWLIQNEAQKKTYLKDAMKAPRDGGASKGRWRVSAKLDQMNEIFRDWFKSEELVGISLKKVTAKKAIWTAYNNNDEFFESIGSKFMKYKQSQCFMNHKVLADGQITFASQDTRLLVEDGKDEYDFQVKANSSSKLDNLKYEPTQTNNRAARMGKATVEYVENLLDLYERNFVKSNSAYPKDAATFEAKADEYKGYIKFLIDKGVQVHKESGKKLTEDECYDNILLVFGTQYWVANSKLMQIKWLYEVMKLQGKRTDSKAGDQLDEFCTDMVYLASKAGPRYGPFAKVH